MPSKPSRVQARAPQLAPKPVVHLRVAKVAAAVAVKVAHLASAVAAHLVAAVAAVAVARHGSPRVLLPASSN